MRENATQDGAAAQQRRAQSVGVEAVLDTGCPGRSPPFRSYPEMIEKFVGEHEGSFTASTAVEPTRRVVNIRGILHILN